MAKDVFVAGLKLIGVFNFITGLVHLLLSFGSFVAFVYVVQMVIGYYLLVDGKHVVQLAFKETKPTESNESK